MSRTTRRRARAMLAMGVLATLSATACTAETPPPPTLRVDRGMVGTAVSASGNLVSITEQNLGFPQGGQLKDVLVGVGSHVEPGQELARLDDFALRQTLEQRQAGLAQQQAELDKIRNGNSVGGARKTLDQAKQILDATEDQAEATNNANASAIDRAKKQLDFDEKALDQAEARLKADDKACDSRSSSSSSTPSKSPTDEKQSSPPLLGSGDEEEEEDSGGSSSVSGSTGAGQTSDAACDRIVADKTAVQDAKRTVVASKTALDSAQEQQNVDEASGRVSVEQAKQSVVSAENDLDSAGSDRPADTSAQEAVVRDAQAQVAIAQRDVDNTVLRAPVAAVVSAINGAPGEFVGAASGTTAMAPGSSAALPDTTDVSGDSGNGATPAPGGGAFMVLNNIDTFQLVVPFEESDASRVVPNARVEVTVDAIPDLQAPATVLAVAPAGDSGSGVVRYYATIVLTGNDPRLRDGQTALADVMVESVDNVLRVPSAAVRTANGQSTVDVRGPDGNPVPTPFEAGLVGDEYTQVVSGLNDGQELVLPQPAATTG